LRRTEDVPRAAGCSKEAAYRGGFFDSLTKPGTTQDIAKGLDVSGGLEIALLKPHSGIGWWAEYPNTKARMGVSWIGGVGVSTPFSTDKTDVTSKVNQSICDAYNNPSATNFTCVTPSGQNGPVIRVGTDDKPFITFVTPDRSRFFRRFYTGMRLKTFFFNQSIKGNCYPRKSDDSDQSTQKSKRTLSNQTDKNKEDRENASSQDASNVVATQTVDTAGKALKKPATLDEDPCQETPYNVFAGIIDMTFGKDEAVTGGHLKGWLFRIEASYPLPFYPGMHVFGSIYTGGKDPKLPPFNAIAIQAPDNNATITPNDSNTFRFQVPPLNRDYFRIGIGVDLVQLFKKAGQPKTTSK